LAVVPALLLLCLVPLAASAQTTDDGAQVAEVVAIEETPYEPPEIEVVGTPSWLRPLSVLGQLPLWAQAAVAAAAIAAAIVVIPTVVRWLWRVLSQARGWRGTG
jgi:hypothetical protein